MGFEVKLHPCRISRRGKAAKGTVAVETFGQPVVNEDGIAKTFLYDELAAKYQREALIEAVSKIADVNVILMMGADLFQKSEGIKNTGQVVLLANRIFALGLAMDKDHASKLAAKWVTNVAFALENGFDNVTIEALILAQTKKVAILKADGLWVSDSPRLVKSAAQDSESEDSDEEDSE